ncbi:MAG: 4Fe-4S binding protein [Anaerolineae bacterium]
MVYDSSRCIGCRCCMNACPSACRALNGTRVCWSNR